MSKCKLILLKDSGKRMSVFVWPENLGIIKEFIVYIV